MRDGHVPMTVGGGTFAGLPRAARVMRLLRATALAMAAAAIAIGLFAWSAVPDAPQPDTLGMTLMPGPVAPVVDSLRSDGAARRAGVQVGDRIVAVDGRRVRSPADLDPGLAHHADTVLTIGRMGRPGKVQVVIHRG